MNEQALKDRLKNLAKTQGTFEELWKLLILERFLARLSLSKYPEKLIFKGGLLLSYYISTGRETTDIDLLARDFSVEKAELITIFSEISSIQLDDRFEMQFDRITDLDHDHMNYPGFRIHIKVHFGKMDDSIQIDIGIGDTVEPVNFILPSLNYNDVPMFEGSISLQVYPPETIFSEKLETLIHRGASNSRMKDYHDLLLLCRNHPLIDTELLTLSIQKTFKNRDTLLLIPIKFTTDETKILQNHWSRHLRTLKASEASNLPADIVNVIDELNQRLHQLTFT